MNEPTLEPKSGFFRIKIELTYDGTNYFGWAKQPDQRTIQGEIEAALAKVIGTEIDTYVAGRTDAGVHAAQQFIHIDVADGFSEIDNLAYRLNRILDPDIRVINCEKASPTFHARYSALSRTYQYKIADGLAVVPPLHRFDTASWFRKLDENLMNESSKKLIGLHDFKAFCKFREGQSTERELREFTWKREGELLVATVSAASFGYSMVRNLVGAAVMVGEGKYGVNWPFEVLQKKERVPDLFVFPANGLTLKAIQY